MLRIPGKIPIAIHPFFIILVIAISWWCSSELLYFLVLVVVLFVSVLWHEFGHALTAYSFGQEVAIELTAFGGVTRHYGKRLKLWQDFLVTFNGPMSGALLFAMAYHLRGLVGDYHPFLDGSLDLLAFVNLLWTIFNLFPILPLDGGYLLSIFLEKIFGVRGFKLALFFSMILASAMAMILISYGILILVALFVMISYENFKSLRNSRNLINKDRKEKVINTFHEADALYKEGKNKEAYEKFKILSERLKKGQIYLATQLCLANILTDEGDFEHAYEALLKVRRFLPDETLCLFHRLAYVNHDYKAICDVGNKVYSNIVSYRVAYINAVAHAVEGRINAAMGWLKCAKEGEMPSLRQNIQSVEFDKIRRCTLFQDFEKSLDWL